MKKQPFDPKALQDAIDTRVEVIPNGESTPTQTLISTDRMVYCVKGMGSCTVEDKVTNLYTGDSLTIKAGKAHSLQSKQEFCVAVVDIPVKKIICTCYGVNYWDIHKAVQNGARTMEEIKTATGAGLDCGGCTTRIARLMEDIVRESEQDA